MDAVSPITPGAPGVQIDDARTAELRKVAQDLEASFLTEMLKAAKFGEPRQTFGGGVGEEQFSSLMRIEVAQDMAASGGIGLAETLFQALVATETAAEAKDAGR